jgi:N4-gp56 family major capsid protein
MALTSVSYSQGDTKKQWEELLFRDIIMQGFFGPKLGANYVDSLVKGYEYTSAPNDVLYVNEKLNGLPARDKAGKGDEVQFTLLTRLSISDYPGVTTGQTLEGKEVALSHYNFNLRLQQYRNAFSAGTPMDWTRAEFPVPKASRDAALNWSSEKIDDLCFTALDTTTYSEVFYKTSDTGPAVSCEAAATAKAALSATNSKLTPQFIDFVATNLKTGGARERYPVRPIKIDGKSYYVWLIHPDAMFDFSNDATMQQAHREAMERGKTNPLFSGSTLVWRNNIIFEHELCNTGTDGGGASVAWATCYILGAQALCWAWGKRPSMIEYTKDAGNELYHAIDMICAVGKPYFNSITYGSALAYVARTNTAV